MKVCVILPNKWVNFIFLHKFCKEMPCFLENLHRWKNFFWLWRSWQISSLLVSWFPSFFQMKVLIENTSVAQSRASWGQWELFRAAWWHLWPKKLHLGRQITKKTGDRKVFWTKRPTRRVWAGALAALFQTWNLWHKWQLCKRFLGSGKTNAKNYPFCEIAKLKLEFSQNNLSVFVFD